MVLGGFGVTAAWTEAETNESLRMFDWGQQDGQRETLISPQGVVCQRWLLLLDYKHTAELIQVRRTLPPKSWPVPSVNHLKHTGKRVKHTFYFCLSQLLPFFIHLKSHCLFCFGCANGYHGDDWPVLGTACHFGVFKNFHICVPVCVCVWVSTHTNVHVYAILAVVDQW